MASFALRIHRSSPAENLPSKYTDFNVPLQEKMTILDALAWVQSHQAYDLAFRYACRVGMCGTCTVVINGREGWACRTLIEDLHTDVITVEPLRHLPIIKDLVVDMRPFFEKLDVVLGYFVPSQESGSRDFALIPPQSQERLMIDPHIECISCGACYSSCTMVYWDKDYVGPAALNRAATLIMDSRDGGGEKRLEVIDGEHGCWRCHSQLNCTEVCPMELQPSKSIGYLKRRVVTRSMKNLFSSKEDLSPQETGEPLLGQVADVKPAVSAEVTHRQPAKRPILKWFSLSNLMSRPVSAALIVSVVVGLIYLAGLRAASKSEKNDFLLSQGTITPTALAGALIFEENGCENCHSILGNGGRSAPDLWRVGAKRDKEWLRKVIREPPSVVPGASMPVYDLPEREMTALVDYVHSLDFSHHEPTLLPRAIARGGGELYRSGCLECHRIGGFAKDNTPDSLRARLLDPRLHAELEREISSRLSEQRIREIVMYLSQQQ